MAGEPRSHKLWGGRFSVPTAAALEALNRSIGIDYRLWPHDVRLSQAWAMALWNAGVLTLEESTSIEQGLTRVGDKLNDGAQPAPADEDVHTMIDRMLHEEVGDVASKLHTGRSRNDQVATATRLWTMEIAGELDKRVRALQQVMIDQAKSLESDLMPAYTHLQRAQPVSGAHWMLSHFWPLERDRARIANVARTTAVLPLGSGAIAGSAYPISRILLQGSLGFTSLSSNSIDAVGDRDFVAEMLFTVAMLGAHLSRLSEDLILYGSSEFGFAKFGEAFTTGSSMMPQKRNPDALELARASGARTLGDLTALLATLKGLPSGYNKDLQDDKRALFGAVDLMLLVLPAVAGALDEITFDRARMAAALSSTMMATDLADYLVGKGSTFRDAHEAVGNVIREGEKRRCELTELPPEVFSAAHAQFGEDVGDWLDARQSVGRRGIPGGTGPEAVRAQIEAAIAAVRPSRDTPRGNQVDLGST
ncbi:MAG: argininosuccinate lyase [Gemmatimonadales bacterium]